MTPAELKKNFTLGKENIFRDSRLLKDAFRFCVSYSLLVEEYIHIIAGSGKYNFAIASAGSFSRRELSPYSDIDLMFITENVDEVEGEISSLVQLFWDCGIEVSHTVREFSDIENYLHKDLHAFTQFFETRFLTGSEKIYKAWTDRLFTVIQSQNQPSLVMEFFRDIEARYHKYGSSSKTLEPNVKFSAGGLRDLQAVEWLHVLKTRQLLTDQSEITQAEVFVNLLENDSITSLSECAKILDSYKFILNVRNLLHLLSEQRNDRLEFNSQAKIARYLNYKGDTSIETFMRKYFTASNILNRFTKTMVRRYESEVYFPLSEYLAVELDDDFVLKGAMLSIKNRRPLQVSEMLRVFYYRGLYGARFDENLRSLVIESAEKLEGLIHPEQGSSVFFREILKLPKNVGETLFHMNELGVLQLILPEFREIIGFFQPGVYHSYTADEHTLLAIRNVEALYNKETLLGKIYTRLKEKEILFLAILFHDIAKPISLSGHEIIGAEIASSVMYRLGYDEKEIARVSFLVANHLVMEQIAFRRNLNDPGTLDGFTSRFTSTTDLDMLYILTFADLSAVNPVVWTDWKSELLAELYRKSLVMLQEQLTGEELLFTSTISFPQKSDVQRSDSMQEHIDSINDIGYTQHFTEEEILRHLEEIEKGSNVTVFFKELSTFTNITIITKDSPSVLSKICGVLSINDLNIHDARIFTRKDGIIIDSFNVSDFRTHKVVEPERYKKIEENLNSAIEGTFQLVQEFRRMKSKWWRIENKFFKRSGKVKIVFEEHEKFTILDVFSPDRLGLLYQITRKMSELGLSIYFAKISTKSDDVVDSFYLLDRNNKKISPNDYEFIKSELTNAISLML